MIRLQVGRSTVELRVSSEREQTLVAELLFIICRFLVVSRAREI